MKHKRIRKYIPELLEQGAMNTEQIYHNCENRFPKICPSINAISNVLAQLPNVECIGIERTHHDFAEHGKPNAVWQLA